MILLDRSGFIIIAEICGSPYTAPTRFLSPYQGLALNMASTFNIGDLIVTRSQDEPRTLSNIVLTNDLIYDIVLSYCTPASFLCLARTCKSAHAAVKSYMQRAFNINRILSRFLTSPLAFRQMQARTGALLSGSAALQFFDRSYYPESDLDIYADFKHRIEVGEFLFKEGYEFKPEREQSHDFHTAVSAYQPPPFDNYEFKGVCAVLTFIKKWDDGKAVKAQMIVTKNNPMEAILGFHSTCVMNVISCDMAYSLYPNATFEERTSLICGSGYEESKEVAYDKYRSRGWDVDDCFDYTYLDTAYHTTAFRWIGDTHCWSIPLDTSFITARIPLLSGSKPIICDPIVISNWVLFHEDGKGGDMRADVLTDPYLACSYVVDPSCNFFRVHATILKFETRDRRMGRVHRDRDYIDRCLDHLRANMELPREQYPDSSEDEDLMISHYWSQPFNE
ncbi:hypothetical protein QCA50_014213 [Cerrena zonata]|uniref:F-box domain-containing protein n=1 Tax=Cerrena zonata TaxID=2478898 RepID=A0AAW0FTF1_9APHY